MAKRKTQKQSKQVIAKALKSVSANHVIEGKFVGNTRGFGFVVAEGGDVHIPPSFVAGAMHGDIVRCKITKEENRTGKIMEIIERSTMVGTFFTQGSLGFVNPVETKIPYTFSVPPKTVTRFGLADGHRVLFSVDKRHDSSDGAIHPCFVTEIIGHMHDPGVDVLSLVYQANVPYKFSDEVMAEANAMPEMVTEAETIGRLDLRHENIFTIDGDDTKDIDDAISFDLLPDGNIRLGVHIADVAHYVTENSALDESALTRGTSIYLADRVIPMLPHRLSSGICSLFQDVDRLTLSCIMTVSPAGHVLDYEIAETVIRSKKRWTYNEVQEILDAPSSDEDHIFLAMDKLRATLHGKRAAKGALDFNLPETKIRVDEAGKPIAIESRERTRATGIIEEFMILCNETVAAHFLKLEAPFVYRTHETPSAEKLARLSELTSRLGFKSPKNADSPLALQRLLAVTSVTDAAQTVAIAVLHSLPQARYTPDNPAHYGLASQAYCHFTSPIRRYADLQVHRIMKAWLNKESLVCFDQKLHEVCAQCSKAERIAETLEREVEQLKKVQFMAGQEGGIFEATVSGVTGWGVFAMLDNTVEGLVPIENLKRNGFAFDKEKTVYVKAGRKKKEATTLRHGEKITVRLVEASVDDRKITFYLHANT